VSVPVNLEELRAALESTYPAEKQAAGQGATVSVAFVLGTDGVPRGVAVTGSTDAAFDSATVAAVSLLRFSPATIAGRPVTVRVEVPVEWEPDTSTPEPYAASHAARDAIAAGGKPSAHELSEVDLQPRPTNLSAFYRELSRVYPPDLRSAGVGATVHVRCVVTERGEVESASVTYSSDARFDAPTIEAVRILRFRPGQIGGHAVRTWVDLPIAWRP
jgi:TonB family protein